MMPDNSGRNSGKFRKGHDSRRAKGKKGVGGRNPYSLVDAARQVFEKHELVEILAKLAVAELGEKYTASDGEIMYSETKNTDRISAIKLLASYGFGMPKQTHEVNGTETRTIEIRTIEIARPLLIGHNGTLNGSHK